jgi:hypothetical protein
VIFPDRLNGGELLLPPTYSYGANKKMNRSLQIRGTLIIALFVFALTSLPALGQTVSLKEINAIQSRSVLTDKDLETLTAYVKGKLTAMISVQSDEDLAKIKRDLNLARYSKSVAAQQVYANRFSRAIKSNYQRVLNQAAKLPDKKLSANVQLSTVILVAETDSVELINDYLALLKNESQAVRYWAAKGLSGPAIFRFLAAEETESESLEAVLAGLRDCLEKETDAMVISAIAAAASISVHSAAIELVNLCVNKRIASYSSWMVDRELEDLNIFRNVLEMVDRDVEEGDTDLQSDLVRHAVRLYAVAYSRYWLGRQCDKADSSLSLLKSDSQQQLETFLIEGERLLRLVAGRFDQNIRKTQRFLKAVDSGKCSELSRSYVLLLDNESGTINRVFDLYPDEGIDPYPSLPDPPVELIEMAQTRFHVSTKAISGTN